MGKEDEPASARDGERSARGEGEKEYKQKRKRKRKKTVKRELEPLVTFFSGFSWRKLVTLY